MPHAAPTLFTNAATTPESASSPASAPTPALHQPQSSAGRDHQAPQSSTQAQSHAQTQVQQGQRQDQAQTQAQAQVQVQSQGTGIGASMAIGAIEESGETVKARPAGAPKKDSAVHSEANSLQPATAELSTQSTVPNQSNQAAQAAQHTQHALGSPDEPTSALAQDSHLLDVAVKGKAPTGRQNQPGKLKHEGNHSKLGKLGRLLKQGKWGKRLGLTCLGCGVSLILGGVLCTLLAVYWAVPDLSKFQLRSNTLYDTNGQLIYEMMTPDDYHRILTTADQVDPIYLKMLLSSEDERFWEHYGVDPWSIARAAVGNVLAGRRISGASTLAMQVCRLLEPKERTFLNKFKEALGALYLTHNYGREQILTMYLTLAPFGGNLEGVTAASFSYFGHSPAHLTPAEAALLVALPRAPEKIRPDKHHASALYYRNEVLTKAVEDGVIQPDILASATREGVPQYTRDLPESALHLGQSLFAGKLHPLLTDLVNNNQAFATPMDAAYQPYFVDAQPSRAVTTSPQVLVPGPASSSDSSQGSVPGQAQGSQQALASGQDPVRANTLDKMPADYDLRMGLRFDQYGRRLPTEVYTTIEPEVQKTLLEVIEGYRNSALQNLPQENVAMLAVDNQTFEVLGYACSDHSYVDVIQAPRSPGSALKPFAYAMAFEQGLVHPNSVLLDLSRIYRTYQPRNYDRMFFGEITAAQALQGSLNLPALEIMRAVGPVNFVDRLNAYPNTITNRYLFTPQVESLSAPTSSLDQVQTSAQAQAPTSAQVQIQTSAQAHDGNLSSQATLDTDSNASFDTNTQIKADANVNTDAKQDANASTHVGDSNNSQTLLSLQGQPTSLKTARGITPPGMAYQNQLSTRPEDYIRGRIKLMSNTTPHLGIILGACGISLYDLTQLYAALAHDGQITPLHLLSTQQAPVGNSASALSGKLHPLSQKSQEQSQTQPQTQTKPQSLEMALAQSQVNYEHDSQLWANGDDKAIRAAKNEGKAKNEAEGKSDNKSDTQSAGLADDFTTLFNSDTARVTYNLLEGLPAPKGFNFDREIKISYKTGTSFKYRDAIAVGSRGRYTIGVWQGRTDGSPSVFALSAYEKTAPLLFRALTLLPEKPVFKPTLPYSGLLNPQPPRALEQLEIKTLGLTGLRRSNDLSKGSSQSHSFAQGLPLEIAYPSDGMQIYVTSGRILLQIQGGKPPYYVLINDQPQTELAYFEPSHNGIYTITAIDSTGASQAVQIWVKGLEEDNAANNNDDVNNDDGK